MNNLKVISEKVKSLQDRFDKKFYKRIPIEKQIWVCQETGELCYFDSVEELNKKFLLESNIIGSYIISQQDGIFGETERLICLGKVDNLYNKEETDLADDGSIKLKGNFNIFGYTNHEKELFQSERNTWWLGKNYTEELTIISKDRYLEILKQVENTGPETIFSLINELNYN